MLLLSPLAAVLFQAALPVEAGGLGVFRSPTDQVLASSSIRSLRILWANRLLWRLSLLVTLMGGITVTLTGPPLITHD